MQHPHGKQHYADQPQSKATAQQYTAGVQQNMQTSLKTASNMCSETIDGWDPAELLSEPQDSGIGSQGSLQRAAQSPQPHQAVSSSGKSTMQTFLQGSSSARILQHLQSRSQHSQQHTHIQQYNQQHPQQHLPIISPSRLLSQTSPTSQRAVSAAPAPAIGSQLHGSPLSQLDARAACSLPSIHMPETLPVGDSPVDHILAMLIEQANTSSFTHPSPMRQLRSLPSRGVQKVKASMPKAGPSIAQQTARTVILSLQKP